MTTDFRALCAELHAAINTYAVDECHHALLERTRAALAKADGPAVPDGREPASVTAKPSDEDSTVMEIIELSSEIEAAGLGQVDFARAVLARWGNPAPQLPADGEVAEVMGLFRHWAEAYPDSVTVDPYWLTRAAELLQRQVPVPVSVDERLPGPEERCWWGRAESDDWSADWTLATRKTVEEFCEFKPPAVWLPAHALPLPEVGE